MTITTDAGLVPPGPTEIQNPNPRQPTAPSCLRRHDFRLVPEDEIPAGSPPGPWLQCRRCHQWARP